MKHQIHNFENKYLIIVTDDYINAGDTMYTYEGIKIAEYSGNSFNGKIEFVLKIVGHLPLGDSKPLEGIPLLPELEDVAEKEFEKIYGCPLNRNAEIRKEGFVEGYTSSNKIYTEEDLRTAYARGFNNRDFESVDDASWKEFTESLKHRLPKWFIPENDAINNCNMFNIEIGCTLIDCKCASNEKREYKTTKNEQGQNILVGKYEY